MPYRVLLARTAKQIQGIKDRELPANIKSQLGKEGKFPEDYHFEGSDIGKRIDNKDTNRAMIREFMEQAYKIEDGLPGKSIIFAMNQTHAEHLQETFEELYPHLHHFSVVITSNVERADQLLQTFKKYTTEKKFRVAISVDMLDTGIDIPALLNLVFAKKVLSQAKFRQMIGRGTRLCPNVYGKGQNKSDFLIIDYCLNFDESHQFKAPNKQPLPLQQQYFELQIKLLKLREHRKKHKYYETTKKLLLAMVNSLVATDERRMNDEILQRYPLIQSILQGQIFNTIALNPYEQLQKIAPLMRYYDKYTAEELRFLIKNEQYLLASLKGEDTTKRRDKIASDINALSPTISKVQEKS
ncbi:MAG: hypothetical protein LBD75_00120 [Candidatus Peribacteria bacterium]|nr:hypothetical protein [Candidatus Peribacteria bacterium]